MQDKVFGRYEKCPQCGQGKGLYYSLQIPIEINQRLDGSYCYIRNGKIKKMSKKELLQIARASITSAEFQMAICCCNICGWQGETIIP